MPASFATLLAAAAHRRGEQPALLWDGGGLTWRQLEQRAGGVARRLAQAGAQPGDVVGLRLPNTWGFVAALWAGLALGVTVTPLNPLLADDERERILGHLRPKAVIDTAPEVETGELPALAGPAAPGIILYTSGSTGQPKGAVLSHAALMAANESWAGPVMGLTERDRVLAALPLAHSFGLNGALLAPLLAGAAVVLQERFSPEETLRAIGRHRVTVFPGVATMFARILEAPALADADLSSLRLAVSGAAPCPWTLASEWRRRTGVRIVRGYGMTELFRPISYLAAEATDHPDSVGRAVPGVELRVVEDELWIRTPAAMDGYLRAPEETAAVLADGWFKTGDLAVRDAAGRTIFIGRLREVLRVSHFMVAPGEIEAYLQTHPKVMQAFVVGVPDPRTNEAAVAYVIPRPGATVTEDEVIAYCRGRIASFKVPRHVRVVADVPRTPGPHGDKVQKARLRALFLGEG
jgi:long-chain acyl-CoA synthetase